MGNAGNGSLNGDMNIQPNQFFDPAQSEFKVEGFYEEFLTAEHPYRCLGWRKLDDVQAPRPLGAQGEKQFTLTEDVVLSRGIKQVTVKAGTAVRTMVQIHCGRSKHQ